MDQRLLMAISIATPMMQRPPLLLVWEEDDGTFTSTIKWLGHFQYRLESGTATWWTEKGKRVADIFSCYLGK